MILATCLVSLDVTSNIPPVFDLERLILQGALILQHIQMLDLLPDIFTFKHCP